MLDFLMMAMLAASFVVAFGYVWACDVITARRSPSVDEMR
jgi:hypothetical protein